MDNATRALLEGPNVAHISTLMADGAPHVAPVWVGVEGEHILFHKEIASAARRNLQRDPRVALSVVDHEDPYRFAWLRGRAVEFRDDPYAEQWLNDTAVRYTGEPYPPEYLDQLGPGNVIVVEPERDAAAHIWFLHHRPPRD